MTLYIPLGTNCKPSQWLRDKNLRKAAYPLDWVVCPMTSSITLIENDFDDFLNYQNLIYLPPRRRYLFNQGTEVFREDVVTPVICTKYNILFPHDFSVEGSKDYKTVKDKYNRRIERFIKIKDSRTDFHFIYELSELNEWQRTCYEEANTSFNHLNELTLIKMLNHFKEYKFMSLETLKQDLTCDDDS